MNTQLDRIVALIEKHPPAAWFQVTDTELTDTHRLQIAVHQAAKRIGGIKMVTRKTNQGLMACRMEME